MTETTDARLMPQGRPQRRRVRVTGYSRFVGVTKLLLVTLAAGLIVLLVVWSQANLDEGRLRIGVTEIAPEEVDSLNMINPRFEGVDDQNRPFSVTADTASQVDEAGRIIELAQPKADITLTDGTWIALTADIGNYDRDADQLDLQGSVNLFHDQGFELKTDRARVDLREGVATGDSGVEGQGPTGELSAEGFRVANDGDRILLTGRSRILVYPSSAEEKQE